MTNPVDDALARLQRAMDKRPPRQRIKRLPPRAPAPEQDRFSTAPKAKIYPGTEID